LWLGRERRDAMTVKGDVSFIILSKAVWPVDWSEVTKCRAVRLVPRRQPWDIRRQSAAGRN
jgi:hypothetical protein